MGTGTRLLRKSRTGAHDAPVPMSSIKPEVHALGFYFI